jgi:hypothetical protein
LPGRGEATYRLKVLAREDIGSLGLQIPAIAPAYKIYENGRLIAEAGALSTDEGGAHAAYKPQTVVFTPSSAAFELTIRASNAIYPHGGSGSFRLLCSSCTAST